MRISVNNYPSPGLVIAAFVAPLFLAACVPAQNGGMRACTQDCRIDIKLPADPVRPPEVESAKVRYHVKAGSDVNFEVDRPGDAARTVLVFSEPAFTDSQGTAVYVLRVRPGQGNRYTAVPGACPAPNGCKYMIVNDGRPEREPLDPWIIIE
ncbi:MAG TPA: hypothetical protein VMQ83_08705 [Gammaproteobacteria bacterium]|nr:hypothetical protein [Gammaproteobacteria bacterium]